MTEIERKQVLNLLYEIQEICFQRFQKQGEVEFEYALRVRDVLAGIASTAKSAINTIYWYERDEAEQAQRHMQAHPVEEEASIPAAGNSGRDSNAQVSE